MNSIIGIIEVVYFVTCISQIQTTPTLATLSSLCSSFSLTCCGDAACQREGKGKGRATTAKAHDISTPIPHERRHRVDRHGGDQYRSAATPSLLSLTLPACSVLSAVVYFWCARGAPILAAPVSTLGLRSYLRRCSDMVQGPDPRHVRRHLRLQSSLPVLPRLNRQFFAPSRASTGHVRVGKLGSDVPSSHSARCSTCACYEIIQ